MGFSVVVHLGKKRVAAREGVAWWLTKRWRRLLCHGRRVHVERWPRRTLRWQRVIRWSLAIHGDGGGGGGEEVDEAEVGVS